METTNGSEVRRLTHNALFALLIALFVLIGALIVAYDSLFPSHGKVALVEGEVAPRDVLAPRGIKYESPVLTKAKEDAAVAAVRPIYDPPDLNITNEQLALARQILDYIENVRYDDFATLEQKKADIASITALSLDAPVTEALLSIEDDATWRAIDAQILRLLERVMSSEVREDNIQAKKDNVPNLISANYSEVEVRIIKSILDDLIRPNTFYNEELTRQEQARVIENMPVEVRTFASGQMIIREGEIATTAHIEALAQFGLLQPTQRQSEHFVSALLVMGLITLVLALYLRRFHAHLFEDPPFIALLGTVFLVFLAGARLTDLQGTVRPYYFPASALAFLVTTLVGPQLGIVMTLCLSALVGLMSGGNAFEFVVLVSFSGILGVLSLDKTERLNGYFVAGGVVGLTSACIALVFALASDLTVELFPVVSRLFGSLVNGVFSAALALVGLYIVSYVMNIPTSLRLVELMQPNHPLLQRLLREAPGTYQHSLQVANLAELGAQQINANAPLVRVAAMYHDAGKILNPHFFVENQVDGVNPHDMLDDAYQSARIIIGHVAEGERLSRCHHLPNRLTDFILEHHGTTRTAYFYQQAVQRAGNGAEVDASEFSYPGPIPQSRETALLMLADACESSVRARRPQSKQDVQETVDYIFETRLQERQLDQSGLTLSDLRVLRDTFVAALQAVFHVRITYPGTPGQPEALPAGNGSGLPDRVQSPVNGDQAADRLVPATLVQPAGKHE